MRILFTTFAWPSHYFAQVPLAWACRAAGHEVRMASQPELEPVIAGSGLTGVLVGHDLDVVGHHQQQMDRSPVVGLPPPPAEWDDARRRRALRGFAMFVELAQAMAGDLLEFARFWRPDLVVFDPLSYAGPLVAQLIGVPAVRNLFGPDIALDLEYQALPPLLERFGVREMDIFGQLSIDPCPPSFQLHNDAVRQFVRYVPYGGLTVVPDWLSEPPARRRVCLTWGTSTTRLSAHYTSWLPAVLKGLCEVDAEVVLAVTAAERELLDDIPDRVRVAHGVPLQALLPTCDAIVHQGGAGTTLTSMLCGLPQVVVAQLADQLVTGGRVAETGLGRCVIPGRAHPEPCLAGGEPGRHGGGEHAPTLASETLTADVREAVTAALEHPGHRDVAGALRDEMLDQPPPAAVVPLLEETVEKAGGAL